MAKLNPSSQPNYLLIVKMQQQKGLSNYPSIAPNPAVNNTGLNKY